jgi:hypothetical protein
LRALGQVQQKLAQSIIDGRQAYNGMSSLRMVARNDLGCRSGSDNDCIEQVSAAAATVMNSPEYSGDFNVLWIAESLRALSAPPIGFDKGEIEKSEADISALRTALETPEEPKADLVRIARSATESVALLSEVSGKVERGIANDVLGYMANIQMSFHGALASVTEPGRRAANSLIDAMDLVDQAADEMDHVAEPLGLPSGHVLINTPSSPQTNSPADEPPSSAEQ